MVEGDVIQKIKDGVYVGRLVDSQWYMEEPITSQNHTYDRVSSPQVEKINIPTGYATARTLLKISIFIGWLAVVVGLLAVMAVMVSGGYDKGEKVLYSLFVFLAGLGVVQANQIFMAIIDTADNTRELLEVMRNK